MMEPERIDEVLRAMPNESRTLCEEALRSLADLSVSVLRMIDARRERGVPFDDSYNEQMLRLALASMADQKFPPGSPMTLARAQRTTADRGAYVLVYASVPDERNPSDRAQIDLDIALAFPTFIGVWHGNYEKRDEESIGLVIRQGLADFNEHATWKDLIEQLERSGFLREDLSVHEVLRVGKDVVRIVFLRAEISCQWLTSGPDDVATADEQSIVTLPPTENN